MRPIVYYGDHHPIPLPPGHKFPIAKYRLLREALEAEGICDLRPAPLADAADIELAHDPAYVRAFLEGASEPAAMRRIGFPWSEELVRRTPAQSAFGGNSRAQSFRGHSQPGIRMSRWIRLRLTSHVTAMRRLPKNGHFMYSSSSLRSRCRFSALSGRGW